ncbi:MAG: DEAD/DEAH box helicase [Acidimicrobiia bacterium]|nr:DEAD/DEAH box helicase [Acidimicrobiia bacterium]
MPHLAEALDRLRADHTGNYQRGRSFERLIRNAFLVNPQYRDRFENLWMWSEWPDAPGGDTGIDLVGELKEGGLCAVQCKFYRSGSVSTTAVDKFLSNTVGEGWKERIFVATGNYSANARKKLHEASTQIITKDVLDGWPVGDWRELIERPSQTLRWGQERHIPRPHQEEALDAIHNGLFGSSTSGRGRVLMPCGSGKSEVGLWAAERNVGLGGRVLYLVPSIALMSQAMRTWAYQQDPQIPHRYVAVCSDTRSGRDTEDADLAELAIPPTTSVEKVASKLKREAPEAMTVVFSTYQSLPVVCDAQDLGVPEFDLVICDEAHRTTGLEKASSDRESPFQLVHNPARLDARRRLFMTATQRIYATGWKKKDREVFSMDDEFLYGPLLYQQSFYDAVQADLLSDYEVVVIAYREQHAIHSFEEYQKQYEENTGKVPRSRILNAEDWVQLVGCWDALADPTTLGVERERAAGMLNPDEHCRRAIVFTNKIVNSKKVAEHWRAVCDSYREERSDDYRDRPVLALDVEHIDGKQNAYMRSERVGWLKGADQPPDTTRVLSNARCLSEGVDVPALDAVLFLAPRQSEIDIVQAVGRVMRRAPGKKRGYIVLPVLVPDGETLHSEEFLRSSPFQQVWRVCRALRAHDERFDALVNAPGLAREAPLRIIDKTGGDPPEETDQPTLPEIDLLPKIASVLVEQVGDRLYWASWGKRAAKVYRRVLNEIERKTTSGQGHAALVAFTERMRETVIPAFSVGDAQEMVAQHAVTIPVFDAFFADHPFADENPVSRHLNAVIAELEDCGLDFQVLIEPLHRSYERIARVFEDVSDDADPTAAKLQVLQDVYEGFFKSAIPQVVARLGIVYTPIPLVDFMLKSAQAACRRHFGYSLGDPAVEILDPFTGTGTFISRLFTLNDAEGQPLLSDGDVIRKYAQELHANDLVLLAYYIATLKIEQAAASRGVFDDGYRPFNGIVLRDTLAGRVTDRLDLDHNPRRAAAQDNRSIRVIVANPPWRSGQKDAGDDNPSMDRPDLEQRVRDTYGRRHKEITGRSPGGNAAGNQYVQALRWASDRLHGGGVLAFVHPNSLATGTSLAGMRAALRDEFTAIYVVNLRGDAYKSGEARQAEGDNVFGQGTRNGVQITVLVRNPQEDLAEPAALHYAAVPECSSLEEKFSWLAELGDVASDQFEVVPVNDRHDWINLTDGTFEKLLPVCSTRKSQVAGVHSHASGVKTNCDVYVYSFSRDGLICKVKSLIEEYEAARFFVAEGETTFEEATQNSNLGAIKWTATLKQSLKADKEIVFDESRIREVLYRPFTKLWLYEDDRILSSVKTVSKMFPRGDEGVAVSGGATRGSNDTMVATGDLADLNLLSGGGDRGSSPVDPDLGDLQHDLPSPGVGDPARPGGDQGITADPGNAAAQNLDRGGGVRCQLDQQPSSLRSPGHTPTTRPLRHGNQPTQPDGTPEEAIAMAGPSNMAIVGVLATSMIPDLHTMGPGQQTRTIHR